METDTQSPALFLSAEAPYPLEGGGALRSASLLNYLARTREVDLIVFRQPGAPDPGEAIPPGLVRHVSVIELPSNRRSVAARVLRNAGRLARAVPPLVDRFSGLSEPIERAIAGRRYSLGIVEHFWCAPYARLLARHCDQTVLDLHNIESELHRRCAEVEPGPKRLAHSLFLNASLKLERKWLPRYSRVLTASSHDAEIALRIAPGARVSVYPNAIPAAPPPPRAEQDAIAFTGNMEYHPNISAVRFFSREVWPRLRERWPSLVWRLVGRNPEAVRQYCQNDPRIEIRGPVESALDELAQSRVAVVPILAGSGTRFKILEAWAAQTPVVSTTVGAEGLPALHDENLLLADSAELFADAVSRLLACPPVAARLARAGRALLENEFTWPAAWRTLDW